MGWEISWIEDILKAAKPSAVAVERIEGAITRGLREVAEAEVFAQVWHDTSGLAAAARAVEAYRRFRDGDGGGA